MAEGFFTGLIQGEQAARANTMFGYQTQEAQQSLDIGRQTEQENDLKIKAAEQTLQQQKMLMDRQAARALMQTSGPQGGPATGQSMIAQNANDLFQTAQDHMRVGQWEQGRKEMATASEMMERNYKITAEQTKSRGAEIKTVQQLFTPEHVTNQAQYDNALQTLDMLYPDYKVQDHMPKQYSPEVIKALQQSSETERNKIEQGKAKAYEAMTKANIAHVNAETAAQPLKNAEMEARTNALKKAGAGNLAAKPADITAIMGKIDPHEQYTKEEVRDRALDVAEAARGYINRDNLAPSVAYNKAYTEAKAQGKFAGLKTIPKQPGSDKSAPLPMPKDIKNPAAYQDNQWYVTNHGPQVWNAEHQGFYVPEPPASAPEEPDTSDNDTPVQPSADVS